MSTCQRCNGRLYIPDPAPDPFDFGGNIRCPDCSPDGRFVCGPVVITDRTVSINALIAQVSEINTANGWRENTGDLLTASHPTAQVAALSPLAMSTAAVIEGIRKPDDTDEDALLEDLAMVGADFTTHGPRLTATSAFEEITFPPSVPVYGSQVEAMCRLRLIDTETAEATEAVLLGDTVNLGEELADVVIRVLDFVGAWNEAHPDKPIDLQAAILAKLEANSKRGHKHGGKTV